MILKFSILAAFLISSLEGYINDEYTLYDQAGGWLKLHSAPTTWTEAKIRCDSEGAVIASPLNTQLRDAIQSHVSRVDESVRTIYTGVHADYGSGDYHSIEGIHLSSVAVKLNENAPAVDYRNSESCVIWDIGNASLRKDKCNENFPYVCFKLRTHVKIVSVPPKPETVTIPDVTLSARDPDIVPNVQHASTDQEQSQSNPQTQTGHRPPAQTDNRAQMNTNQQFPSQAQPGYQGQTGRQFSSQSQPDHQSNSQTQSGYRPQKNPNNQFSPQAQPGYQGQTGQQFSSQSQPDHQSNSQTQSGYRPQNNPDNQFSPQAQAGHRPNSQTQVVRPYPNCAIDGTNLLVVNRELEYRISNYLAHNSVVTIIYADTVYISSRDGSTSMWQVVIDNSATSASRQQNYNGDSSQHQAQPELSTSNGNLRPTQGDSARPQSKPSSQEPLAGSSSSTSPQSSSHQRATDQGVSSTSQTSEQSSNANRPGTWSSLYYVDRRAGGWLKLHQADTWDHAKTRCESEGAVLVSPLTTDLSDTVKDFVARVAPDLTKIYTGVKANFTEGDFYSIEGVGLNRMPVTLEAGSRTDFRSSESCIAMNTHNSIVTTVKCTDMYPYVCLKKRRMIRTCGAPNLGYTYEPRTFNCYKFHRQGKTWSEAYNKCVAEGGYLVIVNDQTEASAMVNLFAKNPSQTVKGYYANAVYVGRRDWQDGKSWMTVKNTSVAKSGYIGWARTEPNNAHGDEFCGTINRQGLMYDDPCGLTLAFICEKDSELLDDPNNPEFEDHV